MKILEEERGQGATELLLAVSLVTAAAITVGYFLKNFITEEVQPEINDRT